MHKKTQIMLAWILPSLVLATLCVASVSAQNPLLTIVAPAHGSTDPPAGTHTCYYMDQLLITAVPDSGYELDYWLLDGEVDVGAQNPILITVDHDQSLQAVFRVAPTQTAAIPSVTPTPAPMGTSETNSPYVAPTDVPKESVSQMSLPIPALAAMIILSVVVIGLIVRKLKPKPA